MRSKCCVQNGNTDLRFSLVEDEQGEAMSGSEGRFPKSLIEFQGALRARACARNTFLRGAGRKGLYAPAAVTAEPGF